MPARTVYGTTTPNVVLPLTLTRKARQIEVINVDGAGQVNFTYDGTDPEIDGNGTEVLPAAICAVPVTAATASLLTIKFKSASAVKVGVKEV